MSADAPRHGCWIIDRKLSLGFILAVFAHIVAVTSWLVRMETRVAQLERSDQRQEAGLEGAARMRADVEVIKSDLGWIRENIAALRGQPPRRGQRP